MARRRSVVRRAGAGRRASAGVLLGVLLLVGAAALIRLALRRHAGRPGRPAGRRRQRRRRRPRRHRSRARRRKSPPAPHTACGPPPSASSSSNAKTATCGRGGNWPSVWPNATRYEALLRMPDDAFGERRRHRNSVAAQLVLDSGGPFTRWSPTRRRSRRARLLIAVNENGLVGRVVSVAPFGAGADAGRLQLAHPGDGRGLARARGAGRAGDAPARTDHPPTSCRRARMDFIVGAQICAKRARHHLRRRRPVSARHSRRRRAAQNDGSWRVALAVAERPIDFVRIIPYVGVETPEDDPVPSEGPPLAASSSVSP